MEQLETTPAHAPADAGDLQLGTDAVGARDQGSRVRRTEEPYGMSSPQGQDPQVAVDEQLLML